MFCRGDLQEETELTIDFDPGLIDFDVVSIDFVDFVVGALFFIRFWRLLLEPSSSSVGLDILDRGVRPDILDETFLSLFVPALRLYMHMRTSRLFLHSSKSRLSTMALHFVFRSNSLKY